MKKETLLKHFQAMGLELETADPEDPESPLSFDLDILTVYVKDEEDYQSLVFTIPGVVHVKPEKHLVALELVNDINIHANAAKVILTPNNAIHCVLELLLGDEDVTEGILTHSLRSLRYCASVVHVRAQRLDLGQDRTDDETGNGTDEAEDDD